MMTLEQIQAALQDRKPSVVADATGLTYQTVWRVQRHKVKAVSYSTVQKLSAYFLGQSV